MSGRGLGGKLCLAAGALAGAGWWVTRDTQDGMDLRVVCYAAAGVLGAVGLSLLVFGTVRFFGLGVIDLRHERPMFWIGLPGLRVGLTDVWRRGALRTHHAGIYLMVPTLLRLTLALMAGWFVGRVLSAWFGWMVSWGMGATVVFVAMLAWRLVPVAANPNEQVSGD